MQKKRCCWQCEVVVSIPLNVAFARSIHKFQGQSVGPTHSNKIMVIHPGTVQFEATCPGLLYWGLSRTANSGNGNIDESSSYFYGNVTIDRLANTTHKRKRETLSLYDAIQRRNWWIRLSMIDGGFDLLCGMVVLFVKMFVSKPTHQHTNTPTPIIHNKEAHQSNRFPFSIFHSQIHKYPLVLHCTVFLHSIILSLPEGGVFVLIFNAYLHYLNVSKEMWWKTIIWWTDKKSFTWSSLPLYRTPLCAN